MEYFIVLINAKGESDFILSSDDLDYISRVFEDLTQPQEYNAELRQYEGDTEEYEVIRYDYSNVKRV